MAAVSYQKIANAFNSTQIAIQQFQLYLKIYKKNTVDHNYLTQMFLSLVSKDVLKDLVVYIRK